MRISDWSSDVCSSDLAVTDLAAATAGFLTRLGESAVDGLPPGSAALLGMSGRDARRLQTGLTHHYFALIACGAAILLAILFIGAYPLLTFAILLPLLCSLVLAFAPRPRGSASPPAPAPPA